MKMKYVMILAVVIFLSFGFSSYAADTNISIPIRNEVVGLFGVLFTPSPFVPASMEGAGFLVYGRTITNEGEVPDFDGDIKSKIDESMIFASGRIGSLGLSVGFGQGSEFEFSQPFMASIDVKRYLLKDDPLFDAAVDLQYSMIVLTEEKEIHVAMPGFGVASVNGIMSARITSLVEPYIGLSFHFIYLNTEEDFIGLLKVIPRAGLQVKLFSPITIGAEVKFINDQNLGSAWMWDIGAGLRF